MLSGIKKLNTIKWLLLVIMLIPFVTLLLVKWNLSDGDSVTILLYDTYYVFPLLQYAFILLLVLSMMIYLARSLIRSSDKLKDQTEF